MSKLHPFELYDTGTVPLKGKTKLVIEGAPLQSLPATDAQDYIDVLVKSVEHDVTSRITWLNKNEYFWKRRYARLPTRHTNWPWPGASDFIFPLMDMTIDELKASLLPTVLTTPRAVFDPKRSDRAVQARTDQGFFHQYLTKHMDDEKKNWAIMLDSMFQWGHGLFKVYWDHRTRLRRRSVRREDLASRYAAVLQESMARNEQAVRSEFEAQLPEGTPLDQAQGVTMAKTLMERGLNDPEFEEKMRFLLQQDFDLDPDDKHDKRAITEIFNGFKNGTEKIVYKTREVESDKVRFVPINPEHLVVPRGTADIQKATRITHQLWLTEATFKQRAKDHDWNADNVKAILQGNAAKTAGKTSTSGRSRGTDFEFERDIREGIISPTIAELIKVWEVYFMMDIDNDGVDEKVWCVVHPDTGLLLKSVRELPYEHGRWPFVKFDAEINEDRYYSSRSICEKVNDLDMELTKRHRAKLNVMDMSYPMIKYKIGSEFDIAGVRYKPAGGVPVVNMDDAEYWEPNSQSTILSEREENSLLTIKQRYIGGLERVPEQGSTSEARTATEVNALRQSGLQATSYRGELLHIGVKELYDMIWDLFHQFGDAELYTLITGEPFIRKTRSEIMFDYAIFPVGKVESADPVLEAQKALSRLQVLMQVAQANGSAVMNGTHKIDFLEALRSYLQRDNMVDAQLVLKELTQEEVQQLQQQQQQQAEEERLLRAAESNVPLSEQELDEAINVGERRKRLAPNKGGQKVILQ